MNKLIIGLLAGITAMLPLMGQTASPGELTLSSPLNRSALVEAVIVQNPGVDALRAGEQAAVSRIEPAGALDDPMLSTGVAPLQYGGNGEMERSFNLELSQSLPWPGKLADREAAAAARSRVAGAEIDILKLKLRELAASAWAEWAFVEQALAINDQHQQLLTELRKTAESQYAAGNGAQQDVLQADVERRLLQKRELELQQQRAELRARINGLLNRSPDSALPEIADLNAPASLPSFTRLADRARVSHPELARIEHQIGGDKARVELAEKDFYPDFRVSAGYNSTRNEPRHRPMIGVSINLPLDQSKREAKLSAAKADLQQTRWQLIDRRAQLLAELESARTAVVEARQSYELYKTELLPLAQDNLDAALADYTAGRSDFINVISAERQQLDTALGLVRQLADYHRRVARLERSVGQPIVNELAATEAVILGGFFPDSLENDHE